MFAVTLSIGVAGVAYDVFETKAIFGLSWYELAFVLFGVTSCIVLVQLIHRIRQFENKRPHMVFVKTENICGQVTTRQVVANFVEGVRVEKPWFARVQIANDPKSALQAVDAIVAAHISFYDSSGQECFSTMIGRWAETPEIAQGG